MLTSSYDDAQNLVRVTKKQCAKAKGKQVINDKTTVTDLGEKAENFF